MLSFMWSSIVKSWPLITDDGKNVGGGYGYAVRGDWRSEFVKRGAERKGKNLGAFEQILFFLMEGDDEFTTYLDLDTW